MRSSCDSLETAATVPVHSKLDERDEKLELHFLKSTAHVVCVEIAYGQNRRNA